MSISTTTHYQHLEPRPGSNYRQLFLKGRRNRAAFVYEAVKGPDPYTPAQFSSNYGVPLEAVRDALDYVANNLPLIEAEREREAANIRAQDNQNRMDRLDFPLEEESTLIAREPGDGRDLPG